MSSIVSPEPQLGQFSKDEELANSITHGIGMLLSLGGLILMATFSFKMAPNWNAASLPIYGAALLLLYTSSFLYHSFHSPKLTPLFRKFDHSAIYLLIAGTYTPFSLVTLSGTVGWTLFLAEWILAIAGVAFTVFFFGRFKVIALFTYILMGWLVIFAIEPLMASMPTNGVILLIGGGILYTGGVVFYKWDKIPYNHAIWHLFVLSGSICHFLCIATYVC
jgi:hemolysin III